MNVDKDGEVLLIALFPSVQGSGRQKFGSFKEAVRFPEGAGLFVAKASGYLACVPNELDVGRAVMRSK